MATYFASSFPNAPPPNDTQAGPPGTTVVTHFLARSTTGTGNNGTAAGAAASYAPHDVPLRLMARGRAALFTTFDLGAFLVSSPPLPGIVFLSPCCICVDAAG